MSVDYSRLLPVTLSSAGKDDETSPEEKNKDTFELPLLLEVNDDLNNKEEDNGTNSTTSPFSEWRICVGTGNEAFRAKNFQSSDFRNPDTGESVILDADGYLTLVRNIRSHRDAAGYKRVAVIAFLYLVVLITPSLVVDKNWNHAKFILYSMLTGMILIAYAVGKKLMKPIYRTLDSQIQELIEQHRENFLQSYGVELGYQTNTRQWRIWNDDSHVWFRIRRQPQAALIGEDEEVYTTPISLTAPLPEEFPPIFILMAVPGDCTISEQHYHPSMKMDRNTWTLIQKAHREGTRSPLMQVLILVVVLPLIPLLSFFVQMAETIGFIKAVGVVGVYVGVLSLFFAWAQQQALKAYQRVAETVTSILQTREKEATTDIITEDEDDDVENRYGYIYEEPLAGYELQLRTSDLPCRSAALCRYQLVRRRKGLASDEEEATSCSSSTSGEDSDDDHLEIL